MATLECSGLNFVLIGPALRQPSTSGREQYVALIWGGFLGDRGQLVRTEWRVRFLPIGQANFLHPLSDSAIETIDTEALGSPVARVPAESGDDAGEVVSPHGGHALRAIVPDEPGRAVEFRAYDDRGLVVTVPISSRRALTIAEELIAAARRRTPE
jgi:hypothetical protein